MYISWITAISNLFVPFSLPLSKTLNPNTELPLCSYKVALAAQPPPCSISPRRELPLLCYDLLKITSSIHQQIKKCRRKPTVEFIDIEVLYYNYWYYNYGIYCYAIDDLQRKKKKKKILDRRRKKKTEKRIGVTYFSVISLSLLAWLLITTSTNNLYPRVIILTLNFP